MADDDMSLGIETDYSRLLECIDGFRALLLPLVEAQEAKKAENPPVVVPQDAQQGATLPDGKHRETKQYIEKPSSPRGRGLGSQRCPMTRKPSSSSKKRRGRRSTNSK